MKPIGSIKEGFQRSFGQKPNGPQIDFFRLRISIVAVVAVLTSPWTLLSEPFYQRFAAAQEIASPNSADPSRGDTLPGMESLLAPSPSMQRPALPADKEAPSTTVTKTPQDTNSSLPQRSTQRNAAKETTSDTSSLAQVAAQWTFQQEEDPDKDRWPENWRRITGRQFPKYLPIEIVPYDSELDKTARRAGQQIGRLWVAWERKQWPHGVILESVPEEVERTLDQCVNRCLEIRLDGGSAIVQSPLFAIDPRYIYDVEFNCATKDLLSHIAWGELELLDADNNTLRTYRSGELGTTTDWTKMRITPGDDSLIRDAKFGLIRLGLTSDDPNSLVGSARFDQLRVWRRPKINLSTGRNLNIYLPGESLSVTCEATGLTSLNTDIHFTMFDHRGEVILKSTQELQNRADPTSTTPSTEIDGKNIPYYISKDNISIPKRRSGTVVLDGTATWAPPLPGPGFYTLRVELGRSSSGQLFRDVSIAVLNEQETAGGGPFGWSLSSEQAVLSHSQIPQICQQAGLGWMKIPVWYDPTNLQAAEETAWIIERLQTLGVRCVGILDQPPRHLRSQFPGRGELSAAQIFQEPTIWQPLLDPVLTRVSLNLVLFQLGADHDLSFQGHANLSGKIADVRKRLQGFGQDIRLGIPWSWLDYSPQSAQASCDFVTLSTDPTLVSDELESYLQLSAPQMKTAWISIDPLPASRYRLDDRIRDIAERMIVVRKNKVEAAFVRKPIDAEYGLIRPDGSPTDLFLPWRTLATNLAEAEYLGTLVMPGGSTNYIFRRGSDAIMVTWNLQPTKERMYFGESLQVWDMWGRSQSFESFNSDDTSEQEVQVGPEPLLLTGLNLPITRWRMSFRFENEELETAAVGTQQLKALFENGFNQGVRGKMEIRSDELLAGGIASTRLDISAGSPGEVNLPLRLRNDASTGKQGVSVDFEIEADRLYRFKAYRTLQIGPSDVEIELSGEFDANGNLVIRQDMINNTSARVSFECTLFVPGRPHQRIQVSDAIPGRSFRKYYIPNGKELMGQTVWLKCEQKGSGRLLNYRLKIQQ